MEQAERGGADGRFHRHGQEVAMDYRGVLDDYYDEMVKIWNEDRARAEAEVERKTSGWVEPPEEEEEWNTGS